MNFISFILIFLSMANIIWAIECSGGAEEMDIIYHGGIAESTVKITSTDSTIYDHTFDTTINNSVESVCLIFGTSYNFELSRKYTTGEGCETGESAEVLIDEYIIITHHNVEVFRRALPRIDDTHVKCTLNEDQLTFILSEPSYLLSPSSLAWKYSDIANTYYDWIRTSYDDSTWNTIASYPNVDFTKTTRYYRNTINLSNPESDYILQIDLLDEYAVIMYINEIKAYTAFIRDTVHTAPTSRYVITSNDKWRTIVLRTSEFLKPGMNTLVFAMEFHLNETYTATNTYHDIFNIQIRTVGTEPTSVLPLSYPGSGYNGIAVASLETNIFDGNLNTYTDITLKANTAFRTQLNANGALWFNRMKMLYSLQCPLNRCTNTQFTITFQLLGGRVLPYYDVIDTIETAITFDQVDATNRYANLKNLTLSVPWNYRAYEFIQIKIISVTNNYATMSLYEIFYECDNTAITHASHPTLSAEDTTTSFYFIDFSGSDQIIPFLTDEGSTNSFVPTSSYFTVDTSLNVSIKTINKYAAYFALCSTNDIKYAPQCVFAVFSIYTCPIKTYAAITTELIINGDEKSVACQGPDSISGDFKYSCSIDSGRTTGVLSYINTCEYSTEIVFPYPQTSYTYHYNDVVSISPNADQVITSMSISSLPRTLTLSQEDYTISGTVAARFSQDDYNLTVFYYQKSVEFTIHFDILAIQCIASGNWPITATGETASIKCGTNLDNYGYVKTSEQTRLCNLNGSWGSVVNNCVRLYADFPYPQQSYTFEKGQEVSIEPISPLEYDTFTAAYLPPGFSFDTDTKIISGAGQSYIQDQSVRLALRLEGNNIYHYLNITILEDCVEEGIWPATKYDTIATVFSDSCKDNGQLTRLCQHNGTWGVIDTSKCEPIVVEITYPYEKTYYSFVIGSIPPSITIEPLTDIFDSYILEGLPTGFTLDSNTGIITAISSTYFTNTTLNLIVSRAGVHYEYEFAIEIVGETCPRSGVWNETPIRQSFDYYYPSCHGSYSTRYCNENGKWSAIDSTNCAYVIPETLYSESTYTVFINMDVNIVIMDGLALDYFRSSNLPDGLVIDRTSGTITGQPTTFNLTHETLIQAQTIGVFHDYTIYFKVIYDKCQPDNGWPETSPSTLATLTSAACINENGHLERPCDENGQWGEVDATNCISEPIDFEYPYAEQSYSFNITTTDEITPITPIYAVKQYDSITLLGLPTGLTIDTNTGIITGIPSEYFPKTNLTVSVNLAGQGTTFIVSFEVVAASCAQSGVWVETPIRETCTYAYPACIESYSTRYCNENGKWAVIDATTCIIASISEPYEKTHFTFTINQPFSFTPVSEFKFESLIPFTHASIGYTRNTGEISGTVTEYTKDISIPIRFFVGGLSHTYDNIIIDILAASCPVEGEWESVPINEDVHLPCLVGYIGDGKSRTCYESGLWSDIVDTCVIITPYYPYNATTYSLPIEESFSGIHPLADYPSSMTFTIVDPLPSGLTMSSSGVITGTLSSVATQDTYRFNVRNIDDEHIVEFSFSLEIIKTKCLADGDWDTVYVGTKVEHECASLFYTGKQVRQCKIDGSWDDVDDTCNLKVPEYPYTEHEFSLLVGNEYTIEPTEFTYFTSMSLDKDLPTGFTLDSTTGIITGTATQYFSNTVYTLTVNNADEVDTETQTFTFNLEILKACAAELGWSEGKPGTTVYIPCESNYKGMQRRSCSEDGIWGTVISECVPQNSIACKGQYYYNSEVDSCALCEGYTIYSKYAVSNIGCITCNSNEYFIDNKCEPITSSLSCKPEGNWIETPLTYTASIPCEAPSSGIQTRKCISVSGEAQWDTIDTSLCRELETKYTLSFSFDYQASNVPTYLVSHDFYLSQARSVVQAIGYNISDFVIYGNHNDYTSSSTYNGYIKVSTSIERGFILLTEINELREKLYASLSETSKDYFISSSFTDDTRVPASVYDNTATCIDEDDTDIKLLISNSTFVRCLDVDPTDEFNYGFTNYVCTQYLLEPQLSIVNFVDCRYTVTNTAKTYITFTITLNGVDPHTIFMSFRARLYGILLQNVLEDQVVLHLKTTQYAANEGSTTTYIDGYVDIYDTTQYDTVKIKFEELSTNENLLNLLQYKSVNYTSIAVSASINQSASQRRYLRA